MYLKVLSDWNLNYVIEVDDTGNAKLKVLSYWNLNLFMMLIMKNKKMT